MLIRFLQISVKKATLAALQKLSGLTNREQLMELLESLGAFEESQSKKLEGAHDLNKRNEVYVLPLYLAFPFVY